MNLRRKTPPDSLYLLLDTLCNAFGGIILLAVLVVLLTTKEKSQGAAAGISSPALQNRLAVAEASLQASRKLAASLQAKADDGRWRDQLTLLSTRKGQQEALQQIRDTVAVDSQDIESANAADPTVRLKFLNAQLAQARTQRLAAQNDLVAAQNNNKVLEKRKSAAEKQVAQKFADSERTLRLPKEHDPGKRVVYLIVRYGRIYPCKNVDASQNDTDIKWTSTGAVDTAEPIPSKGYSPDTIGSYLTELSPNEVYAVYCVFEDSFPAFIRARQETVAAGLIYGWEPFLFEEGPVRFSMFGSVPGAQ